jgi:hypothetical protein
MAETPNQPPKRSTGDLLHAGVRGGLGAIPFGGTAAIELFNSVVTPPLERRRDEWRQSVADRLHHLENAGYVTLGDLQENEVFITAAMQATQAALRNHQREKLDALRNAVINAAMPDAPDDSLQQVFIQLVDSFTVWHLRILSFLQNPKAWFQRNEKQPPDFTTTRKMIEILLAAYPELHRQPQLCTLVDTDLHARGLVSGAGLNVDYDNSTIDIFHQMRSAQQMGATSMMSVNENYWKRTTDFGDRFLQFITEHNADA